MACTAIIISAIDCLRKSDECETTRIIAVIKEITWLGHDWEGLTASQLGYLN